MKKTWILIIVSSGYEILYRNLKNSDLIIHFTFFQIKNMSSAESSVGNEVAIMTWRSRDFRRLMDKKINLVFFRKMTKVDRKAISLFVKQRKIRIKFLNTSMKNKNHRLTLEQLTTLWNFYKERDISCNLE